MKIRQVNFDVALVDVHPDEWDYIMDAFSKLMAFGTVSKANIFVERLWEDEKGRTE